MQASTIESPPAPQRELSVWAYMAALGVSVVIASVLTISLTPILAFLPLMTIGTASLLVGGMGLPLYVLLRERGKATLAKVTLIGTAMGTIALMAALAVLDLAFVLDFFWLSLAQYAIVSLVTSAVFWLTLHAIELFAGAPAAPAMPATRRNLTRAVAAFVLPVAVLGAAEFATVTHPACHTALSDPERSVSASFHFQVRLKADQLGEVASLLETFADAHDLSFLTRVPEHRPGEGIFNVCHDTGTTFSTRMMVFDAWQGARVTVLQPKGGIAWRPVTLQLIEAFDARWPRSVVYIDHMDKPISRAQALRKARDGDGTPNRR